MSFYVSRGGQVEGPFDEASIVSRLQSGDLRDAQICPVGSQAWQPIASHPPFAQAMQGGGAAPQPRGATEAIPSMAGGAASMPGGGAAPAPGGAHALAATEFGGQAYGGPPQGGAPGQPTEVGAPAYGGMQPGHAGAPAQAGGYGPPPGGGYGAPPGGQHAGAPAQAGMQPGGGMPGAPGGAAGAPKKKGGSTTLVVAILGIVALLGLAGGGFALWYFMFRDQGPEFAKSMPQDVQIYAEFPSVQQSAMQVRGIEWIDQSKINEDQSIDDLVDAIANSFDISKTDARIVLISLDAYGAAARNVVNDPEAVLVVQFKASKAAKILLESSRFTSTGTFGSTGEEYTLSERAVPAATLKAAKPLEQGLSKLKTDGKDEKLVWFKKRNLLMIGKESLLYDIDSVIDGKNEPLEKTEVYKQAAKEFDSGAELVAFVDSQVFHDVRGTEARKMANGFFDDTGPFVGTVKFVDQGMLVNLHGQLAGKMMPDEKFFADAVKLELPAKLPDETFAYVAFSSKMDINGRDARDALIERMYDIDENQGKRFERSLNRFETEFGLGADKIFDMVGDEGVVAFVASKAIKIDPSRSADDMVDELAAVYVQHAEDMSAAKTVVRQVNEKLFAEDAPLEDSYDVKKEGDGFFAEPKTAGRGAPSIMAKFEGATLIAGIGSKKLLERSADAIVRGKDTLGADEGHNKSMGALPDDAHVYMWVDVGRVGDVVLKSNPDIKTEAKKKDIPVDAIVLTGENRITSAMAIDYKLEDGKWTYNVDSLNVAAIGPMAFLGFIAPRRGFSGGLGGSGGSGSGEDPIGIRECDEYFETMETCLSRQPPAVRSAMEKSMNSTRERWRSIAEGPGRSSLARACSSQLRSLKSSALCR